MNTNMHITIMLKPFDLKQVASDPGVDDWLNNSDPSLLENPSAAPMKPSLATQLMNRNVYEVNEFVIYPNEKEMILCKEDQSTIPLQSGDIIAISGCYFEVQLIRQETKAPLPSSPLDTITTELDDFWQLSSPAPAKVSSQRLDPFATPIVPSKANTRIDDSLSFLYQPSQPTSFEQNTWSTELPLSCPPDFTQATNLASSPAGNILNDLGISETPLTIGTQYHGNGQHVPILEQTPLDRIDELLYADQMAALPKGPSFNPLPCLEQHKPPTASSNEHPHSAWQTWKSKLFG